MDGVIILNTHYNHIYNIFSIFCYALCAIILYISVCIIIHSIQAGDFPLPLILVPIFGILLGIVGYLFWTDASEPYYQVITEDSVSLNEFMDRYNIIKHEGKTYIVTEKKGDN